MTKVLTLAVRIVLLPAVCLIAFSACTTTAYFTSGSAAEPTGSLSILLSSAAPQVSVLVDDRILVDARIFATRRVDVLRVPAGTHSVRVFANSWQLSAPIDFSETIDIGSNKNVPVVIQVPPYSTLYWVYVIAIGVASMIPVVVVY